MLRQLDFGLHRRVEMMERPGHRGARAAAEFGKFLRRGRRIPQQRRLRGRQCFHAGVARRVVERSLGVEECAGLSICTERAIRLVRPGEHRVAEIRRLRREVEFIVAHRTGPGIGVRPHVAPRDPTRLRIDRRMKAVTHTHRKNLRPTLRGLGEKIAGRDVVAAIGARTNAQDFSTQVLRVAARPQRIAHQAARGNIHRRAVERRRIVARAKDQMPLRLVKEQPAAHVDRAVEFDRVFEQHLFRSEI